MKTWQALPVGLLVLMPAMARGQSGAGSIRFDNPVSLPPARGYSQVVDVPAGSRLVFLSGQVPFDSTGRLVGPGNLGAQAEQVFENLRRGLAARGLRFANVVKLNFYVIDATHLATIRAVRDRYVDADAPPASSLVEVPRLFRPDVLIEVDAVAAGPDETGGADVRTSTPGQGSRPAARVLDVPAHFATVQLAIDSARDGDTVLVAPGHYYENIGFRDRAIVLASRFVRTHDVADIEATILDGSKPRDPDTASVVRIVGRADLRAALIGFTITGGRGTLWPDPRNGHVYVEGGGVLCEFASPLIAYNIITGNDAAPRPGARGAGGGGIRCGNGEPEIAHNVIVENHGPYGGGLVLYYTAAHVHDNLIAWNTGGETFGGAAFWIAGRLATTAPTILRHNTIAFNRALPPVGPMDQRPAEAGRGGAILVYSGGVYANLVVDCANAIVNNEQAIGSAVVAQPGEVDSSARSPHRGPVSLQADTSARAYLRWARLSVGIPAGGRCGR